MALIFSAGSVPDNAMRLKFHKETNMADKSDNGGQPSLEKLQAEGIPLRKCIASDGMPGYGGNGGSKPAGNSKPVPALSSYGPVRKGRGY
jgi:hypothetical protein